MEKPIKSQNEADQVFESVVNMAMETMKIDRDQAEKRTRKLLDSDVFSGNPNDPNTQRRMDEIMQTQVD